MSVVLNVVVVNGLQILQDLGLNRLERRLDLTSVLENALHLLGVVGLHLSVVLLERVFLVAVPSVLFHAVVSWLGLSLDLKSGLLVAELLLASEGLGISPSVF